MFALVKVLPPAIENIQGIVEEIKLMTPEQKAELVAWAKADFDLAHDQVELVIEQALPVVLSLVQFLLTFKKAKVVK